MKFVKLFESELPGNHSLQKGFDELKKLSYLPGGMTLLENSFIIEDDAAVA